QALESRLGPEREIMHKIITRAQQDPRRIVLPEGDNPVILRAAHQAAREGIAKPLLLGNEEKIRSLAKELQVPLEGVEILDNFKSPLYDRFVEVLSRIRARKGWSLEETRRQLRSRFIFGAMMVLEGHVDGQVHGISRSYPDAIRPVLQVIPRRPGVSKVSGIYLMILKGRTLLLADTTVNFHPSSEDLAEIAALASEKAAFFDITPRIAMVSFSNFGSTRHPDAMVVEEAVKLSRIRKPNLVIDGEMQVDTALSEDIMKRLYPFSRLGSPANVLIFPNLDAGNAAFKLLERAGGAKAVGPLLMGISKPFNVLQRSSDMENAVNVIAITVAQAQEVAKR
ncbi:MAG: phosphate acyltransferase, partial [Deltaproteobacteria bacterium]|nr:phosphate acyltransferase [Deltaproteobacteria bacterium]